MGLILQQQKRKTKKVPVDLVKEGEFSVWMAPERGVESLFTHVAGVSHDRRPSLVSLGEKEENLW